MNGDFIKTNVTLRPLTMPAQLSGMLLITLQETSAGPDGGSQPAKAPAPTEIGTHDDVERELVHTRETLQTTIEELETSNEELKSSNEELQSTNEELQSTNEE